MLANYRTPFGFTLGQQFSVKNKLSSVTTCGLPILRVLTVHWITAIIYVCSLFCSLVYWITAVASVIAYNKLHDYGISSYWIIRPQPVTGSVSRPVPLGLYRANRPATLDTEYIASIQIAFMIILAVCGWKTQL